MRIIKKFISLTSKTYPNGTERELIPHLPVGYKEDGFGNFYLMIGDSPSTMFTCHLDTADRIQSKVNHIFEDGKIKTDGTSILGADDKAGMTVILYMISKKVPGLYYFFIGEEVGCIGSSILSKNWHLSEFKPHIRKVVSFDRRGTESIITHQMMERCCSEKFAKELANRMNSMGLSMRLDDTGILTDSINFVGIVPECTNISVGYQSEHTVRESQDADFLVKICKCAASIDWETLPSEGFEKEEYFSKTPEYGVFEPSSEWSEENWTWVSNGERAFRAYLSQSQIDDETEMIWEWMVDSKVDAEYFTWNGRSLHIEKKDGIIDFIDRVDLIESIPSLKRVSSERIRERIR